jgi:glutaredoxin
MIGMIEIYSMNNCPFCVKAKDILMKNNLMYFEYRLNVDYFKEDLAVKLNVAPTEKITLPQIFLDNESIGGYNELKICMDAVKMMKHMNMKGVNS